MWPPHILAAVLGVVALGLPQGQPADFAGTWTGRLTNLPGRPGAAAVDVTREIGALPTATGCTPWKTTYREGGEVRQVKDYRLCRDADAWYVDEGDGVRLTARFLGDVLMSSFKYGNLLLVVRTEVHGDVMEEDIMTADDRPATAGIVSLTPRSLQRLRLTRSRSASGRVQ